VGFPNAQGLLDDKLVVGVDDPLEILGFDGHPVIGDFDERFGGRNLLQQDDNFHGKSPFCKRGGNRPGAQGCLVRRHSVQEKNS
jgi:hypothetical protein